MNVRYEAVIVDQRTASNGLGPVNTIATRDILIDCSGFKFFFPFTIMPIVSVVLSLLIWLLRRQSDIWATGITTRMFGEP